MTRNAVARIGAPKVRRGTAAADMPADADRQPAPKTLQEAKRQTEVLRRKILDINFRLRRGELIEKAANDRQRFAEGRAIRDRFLALPPRIAAELFACESVADTQRVLAREIRDTLETCANELR
jgi:hypothetical protein